MVSAAQKKLFSRLVKDNNKFIVAGHQGPDGDVIGSTMAVVLGLKQLRKKVVAFNHDECPYYLKFLPKSDQMTNSLPSDTQNYVLITVDSGDLARLGDKIGTAKFKEIWNIDHHKSNTKFGKHNFIDVKAGSTGVVALELMSACRGFKLNKDIAQSVFCTLSTDTGSFRYSNANLEVFTLAGRLVKAGAQPHVVSEALYETYPARRLHLLRRILESLSFEQEGKVAKLWMTENDLKVTGAVPADSEEFVNLPRGVVGVKVVCFIKEKTPTEWKVSFRARGDVNVLKIAEKFGGGGHKLAAGCTVRGNRDAVERQVDDAIVGSGVL